MWHPNRPELLLPQRVEEAIALLLLLKIFHDGAEVNRLNCESAILRDFRLIHHFESVSLEQFGTAPAVECHHLRVYPFDAVIVEMVQISFNKLPTDHDRLGCRKKVDVEMSNGPGSRGHFTPGF